ncbi:MAG TPA: rod shape-determining protein MreD [Aliiroseovarius sp.]|nr:rod shape-determining protein MreD [Aliiroseovarius sp.]
MIDPRTFRLWFYRALLVLLIGIITFVHMLPLSTLPAPFPGPDLILGLVFAWVLRRPEYVPVLLVAVLFFLIGMIKQSPPGLHAALVVLGVEFLRQRAGVRDRAFLAEWGMVAGVMAMILLGERLILTVMLVEQVSFGKAVLRYLMSVAAYPVIAGITVFVLRVRQVMPGEADAVRHGL